MINPGNRPYGWIEKIGNLLAGFKTLFLIDDIIADETLDKRRHPLFDLAISGRHRKHSLWLLTQSYTAVPKNIRRQAKMLYVWYPKNRTDLKTIHEEYDVIETPEELTNVKNENGASKSLPDSLSFVTKLLQVLSKDYSTPIIRLKYSCLEITALLS